RPRRPCAMPLPRSSARPKHQKRQEHTKPPMATTSPPRHTASAQHHLGDFVAQPAVLPLAGLAIGLGVVSAFLAFGLLRLIGLFTTLFYFQRVGWEMTPIETN